MNIGEKQVEIKLTGDKSLKWFLDLTTDDNAELPFLNISPTTIDCSFRGVEYSVNAEKGTFSEPGNGIVYRMSPEKNSLMFSTVTR